MFLVLTTVFISCYKDDDNTGSGSQIDVSLIVGEWDLTVFTLEDGEVTTTVGGLPVTIEFSSFGKDFDQTVTFVDTTDPNTFISTGGYTSVIITTILGQSSTQEETIDDFLAAGELSVNGNNMIFTNSEGDQTAQITNLTATSLSMKVELNEVFEEQGVTTTTSGIVSVTFEKN